MAASLNFFIFLWSNNYPHALQKSQNSLIARATHMFMNRWLLERFLSYALLNSFLKWTCLDITPIHVQVFSLNKDAKAGSFVNLDTTSGSPFVDMFANFFAADTELSFDPFPFRSIYHGSEILLYITAAVQTAKHRHQKEETRPCSNIHHLQKITLVTVHSIKSHVFKRLVQHRATQKETKKSIVNGGMGGHAWCRAASLTLKAKLAKGGFFVLFFN